jgi:alpha-galactosidase
MPPPATIAITSYTVGDVSVDLVVSPDAPVGIVALRPAGVPAVDDRPDSAVNLVELGLLGDGRAGSASVRHERLATSQRLRPVSIEQPEPGRLIVEQADETTGLVVTTELRLPAGTPAALGWTTTVTNGGRSPATLSYLSSAVALGAGTVVDGPVLSDTTATFAVARNAWCAEARWLIRPLPECGLVDSTVWPANATTHGPREGAKSRVLVAGYGTWSTSDFLPMGAVSAGGSTWLWQIEHNGPWAYDLSDWEHDVSARLSGPNDTEHDWRHVLAPGESFRAVPATTVVTQGSLGDALRVLTTARRAGRRHHEDNVTLPVIFNDYMNCLMGDPTTAKLLPVIASAAAAGAEYFVIDAGWYSDDGGWWETVGEWLPSTQRFPDGGLKVVIDAIHDAGMVPGMWLEPEVIGVKSPLAQTLPDDAFFSVDGIRIAESGRYQLDFRHPAVIAHLNETVDRLVGEFGVGYFKLD